MAPKNQDTTLAPLSQIEFQALLRAQVQEAIRLAFATILEAEVEAFVGALRYERTPARRDQRNVYYTRGLETSMGSVETWQYRARAKVFRPSSLTSTNVAGPSWTKPSARCSSRASAPVASARWSKP